MAVILSLAEHRREARSPRGEPTGRSADILIFTGVRYERWADEAEPHPKPRSKTTKRKKRVRQA